MEKSGISPSEAKYFMPPCEWYNDSISRWTKEAGLQLVSFTSGTLSGADYTTPGMKNYTSGEAIFQSLAGYEKLSPRGLNGFILLIHIGTAPERIDKFYLHPDDLILWLQEKKYALKRVDELLTIDHRATAAGKDK